MIAVAWILSTRWVRRALPFESAVAFGVAGVVMVSLLLSGRLV